jgi:hypothetical protein
MKQIRDLQAEIDHKDAVTQVATTIADFMDVHDSMSWSTSSSTTGSTFSSSSSRLANMIHTTSSTSSNTNKEVIVTTHNQKHRLLDKIASTHAYLRPLLHAMELEGSYHIGTPRYDIKEGDVERPTKIVEGSPWAAMVQRDFVVPEIVFSLPSTVVYTNTTDEFHQSWWINPFHDPPFYHPTVQVVQRSQQQEVSMKTVSEAVYEKTDYFFDGGFFSNAASEIRAKFNSPQAIQNAILKSTSTGVADVGSTTDAATTTTTTTNLASRINAHTIAWAQQQAPDIVQQRYTSRGIYLVAGNDIAHHSGPGWIWSYLTFRRGTTITTTTVGADERPWQNNRRRHYCHPRPCMYIDSHTMSTPLDHPVPFAGGKFYCKLLSPVKALDWMYTDSLRPVWSWETILTSVGDVIVVRDGVSQQQQQRRRAPVLAVQYGTNTRVPPQKDEKKGG